MKKQEYVEYLLSKNKVVGLSMTAIELKDQVRKHIKEMVPVEVVKRARESPLQHKVCSHPHTTVISSPLN